MSWVPRDDDKRMELELGHKKPLKAPMAAPMTMATTMTTGMGSAPSQPHLIGHVEGALQQGSRYTGGQAHDTSGRQVGTGENNTAADAQSRGQIGRRLGNDVDNGAGAQEIRVDDGNVDDGNDHQDDQGVIEDEVAHLLG